MLYQLSYTHHGRGVPGECPEGITGVLRPGKILPWRRECLEPAGQEPAGAAGAPSAAGAAAWSTTCFAAIERAESVLGPGSGTSTASR